MEEEEEDCSILANIVTNNDIYYYMHINVFSKIFNHPHVKFSHKSLPSITAQKKMPKMLSTTPDSSNHNPFTRLINSIPSYDSNVMLAAVISLLLVILFVLLLHIYAKWFLAQARYRRRSSSVSVSHVLRPSRFHHFHAFTFDTFLSCSPTKGLDSSVISSIPLFVYKAEEYKQGLECVICLSTFEENEVGRSLAKCGHGFHVECIDMWLHSHPNCPICRAPAMAENDNVANDDVKSMEGSAESREEAFGEMGLSGGEPGLEIMIDVSNSEDENGNLVVSYCDSTSESESSSSSSLGSSLKRMLSRNRSDGKVFPSRNVNATELDA